MTEPTPSSLLSDLERDRLALYLDPTHPRVPRWFWPGLGLGSALLIAVNDLGRPFLTILAVALFGAFLGLSVTLVQEASGIRPRIGSLPLPLRRVVFGYWALAALLLVGWGFLVSQVLALPLPFTAFGVAVGLVTGLGGWITERIWTARARELARRMELGG
jgi:hypothetical protein